MPKRPESIPQTPAIISKNFYDTYGWQTDEISGTLLAESYHQDLSEAGQRYRFDHEWRYQKYLEPGGAHFLDAGCGGMPKPQMSKHFQNHIYFDISITGLKEARRQLGDRGAYILGDLAALPFKSGSFDGVFASHCLYHVDKELQVPVLRELYRVTKIERNLLVFYSSRFNFISLIHWVPKMAVPLVNRMLNPLKLHLGAAPPYLMTLAGETN